MHFQSLLLFNHVYGMIKQKNPKKKAIFFVYVRTTYIRVPYDFAMA